MVENFQNIHFGPRIESQVIAYLRDRVDYFENIGYAVEMQQLYEETHLEFHVSTTTARRWYESYEIYGELPSETAAYWRRIKNKHRWLGSNCKLNQSELEQLKGIIDNRPDLYLDEIALVFGIQTGKYVSYSSLWRHITHKLNDSLQSLTEIASQQCELTRVEFKQALDLALREKPEMLCMVDETHHDRNASRRRWGYGKRNGGGLKIDTWFKNVVRYTVIGVADINGFIVSACNTYIRDEISDEGAAGTVTREVFEDWVEKFLCPHLGDYFRSSATRQRKYSPESKGN